MSVQTITFGNKKTFAVDASTGNLLLTIADLNEILSTLTATVDSPAPARWLQVSKTYADFAAASTTNDIEVYSLPAGATIHATLIKHSTAFAGGSLSSYTISLGVTGALTQYAGAEDVFQAVADTTFQYADYTGGPTDMGSTATSVRAAATGSHDLDTATAGAVDIYLLVSQLFEAA